MAAAMTPFLAPDSCGSRECPPEMIAAETSAVARRRSSPYRSSSGIAAHGRACAAESHHSAITRSTNARASKSCTGLSLGPRSCAYEHPLRPASAEKMEWGGAIKQPLPDSICPTLPRRAPTYCATLHRAATRCCAFNVPAAR